MAPLSILLIAIAFAASACMPRSASAANAEGHNSRNSLDWAATYEGVLACADCPGVRTRLTLRRDGSYEMTSTYLESRAAPRVERGKFAWQPGGNAIELDGAGGSQQFAVGEDRLAWIEPDAAPRWPQPARFVLARVAQPAPSGVQGVLESHRWTLETATDAQGKPIAGLPAAAARTIVFRFADGRLHVEGGCNRSFGSYRIDGAGRLHVGRMASTMIGCDPAKMKIDADLGNLLAEPVAIELTTRGDRPRLRLVSAEVATLSFSGLLTPEARYGAATRVFLEVAPEPVACNNPLTGATGCLQVRERVFDDKGLAVNPPGAWRPLFETIEGYTHQPGVRNVLRLKRFEDKAGDGSVYVLDMIVESERAAR